MISSLRGYTYGARITLTSVAIERNGLTLIYIAAVIEIYGAGGRYDFPDGLRIYIAACNVLRSKPPIQLASRALLLFTIVQRILI